MTSDERREMAEQLRNHNGHYYEELVNMSDSDLADLIDPTSTVEMKCIVSNKHFGHMHWLLPMCSACGRLFDGEVPHFCPNCGSRLVNSNEAY